MATKMLTVPALDPFLYMDLHNTLKRRVALLLQRMLDVMQQPTPSQPLCEIPMATPPQLTHMQGVFSVHGNFRTTDFGPSTGELYDSVSL